MQGLPHPSMYQVSLTLSEGLNYEVKCKKITLNPMYEVDTPNRQVKTVETFSAEEVKMILGKAIDHRLSAFFILACHIGEGLVNYVRKFYGMLAK